MTAPRLKYGPALHKASDSLVHTPRSNIVGGTYDRVVVPVTDEVLIDNRNLQHLSTRAIPMPTVGPVAPRSPSAMSLSWMNSLNMRQPPEPFLNGEGQLDGSGDDDDALPDEDVPVVPPDLVEREVKPIVWRTHSCSSIVMELLFNRGVTLPLHNDLVEYHMAEAFLEAIKEVSAGSYFVKYKTKHAPPKERYVFIQEVSNEDTGRRVPSLCWKLHQTAVHVIDRVPLACLVGVARSSRSPSFRKHLISHDVIKGCYSGQHKCRLSTRGCFSLWFFDRKKRKPVTVDLLTTNMNTFHLWTRTMDALLSVNSVQVVAGRDPMREMQSVLLAAEQELADEENESGSEGADGES